MLVPMQSFYGEIFVEDPNVGRHSLYAAVGEHDGEIVISLHNATPPDSSNFIGFYGSDWLLKKVKWKLLVTVYELTSFRETPPAKVRCVTAHKFGKMLENAIGRQKLKNP
jgi:hypothetical protein